MFRLTNLSRKFLRSAIAVSLGLFVLGGFATGVLAANMDPVSPAVGAAAQPAAASIPPVPPAPDLAGEQEVVVKALGGEVLVQRKDRAEWVPVQEGDKLSVSDRIKTGDQGAVEIHFDGKTKVFLAANTEVTVQKAMKDMGRARETLLKLHLGRVRAKVDKQGKDSIFKVLTPTAVATVRGTDLYLTVYQLAEAAAQMITDLYVDEGAVDFSSILNLVESIVVDRFGSSSIGADGTILPLRHLGANERDDFVQNFQDALAASGNPQMAVEVLGLPGGPPPPGGALQQALQKAFDDALGEALKDKSSEQDVSGGATQNNNAGGNTPEQNRAQIASLLSQTEGREQDGMTEKNDQQIDVNEGDLLANGPADSGDWQYQVLHDNFEQGIASDDAPEQSDQMTALLEGGEAAEGTPSTVDSLNTITNKKNDIDALLRQANATDDNAGFVPPAQDAANQANASLAQIRQNTQDIDDGLQNLKDLRAREKSLLKGVLDSVLDDQQERLEQGQQEREFDAQTGKVFVDAFGNRVRTDSYVFYETGSNAVKFLALTLRTGDYQNGVTAFSFQTLFNRGINSSDLPSTGLKGLPWNDYFNVVTREEMADALGIPETIYGEGGWYTNPEYTALYSEYIVHQDQPGLANAEGGLYPSAFNIDARGPQDSSGNSNRIEFKQNYGSPHVQSIDEQDVPVQGLEWDTTIIQPLVGDKVEYQQTRGEGGEEEWSFYVNDVPRADGEWDDDDGGDGEQSEGFASDPNIGLLVDENGINYYRNHPTGDVQPAHFEDKFTIGEENYVLIGIFLPIDNLGNVIDAPGFNIEGPRDVLNPNTLVDGGNYNLQLILAWGHDVLLPGAEVETFSEDFRIDGIITPEIFQPYGIVSSTALFPDTFDDGDSGDGGGYDYGPT